MATPFILFLTTADTDALMVSRARVDLADDLPEVDGPTKHQRRGAQVSPLLQRLHPSVSQGEHRPRSKMQVSGGLFDVDDMQGIAIVAISRKGSGLGERLAAGLGDAAALHADRRFLSSTTPSVTMQHRVVPFDLPLRPVIERLFREYRRLVLLMPVSAAVRLLAPLVNDKGWAVAGEYAWRSWTTCCRIRSPGMASPSRVCVALRRPS